MSRLRLWLRSKVLRWLGYGPILDDLAVLTWPGLDLSRGRVVDVEQRCDPHYCGRRSARVVIEVCR